MSNNIGHNLRLLRLERDISARELSIELNLISERRIGDIETPARNIKIKDEELQQIAKYFNVSVDDLVNKKATIIFK